MAREESRVPRKPPVAKHSLRGPGQPKIVPRRKEEEQRLRASAAANYEDEEDYYDEDEDDAGSGGIMVPTRYVKFIAAVLLLPVVWVLSLTFFQEFNRVAVERRFWATEEFFFFGLGLALWIIAFWGLPRPLKVYVFGHELTHALWVWIQLGEVSDFKVERDGGYIIADRRDFLTSLAPYFFPLYSIIVIGVWAAVGHWYPWVWEYRRWFFAAIGVTWGFHLTFTCWMIPKQQTDLLLHGTFFSLVIIYLANLCVLTILLVTAHPRMTWEDYGGRLRDNAVDFSVTARREGVALAERLGWLK